LPRESPEAIGGFPARPPQKQFECRAFLTEYPDSLFEHSVENPLVNIINPHTTRMKIEEAEEKLRQKSGGGVTDVNTYVQLAKWHDDLDQKEKALTHLSTALSILKKPDADILNLQGIYFSDLGDFDRAEKAYKEAAKASSWNTPLFNLALGYQKRGRYAEATEILDSALKKEGNRAPSLTLKAICLMALSMSDEGRDVLKEALHLYGPLEILSDWELGWCYTAAELFGDREKMEKVEWVRNKRREGKTASPVKDEDVLRPAVRDDLKH